MTLEKGILSKGEFINPFSPYNFPHCDDVERGLCHVIENGEDGPEAVLKEKFDMKHLEDYDKLFGTNIVDRRLQKFLDEQTIIIENRLMKLQWEVDITFERTTNEIIGLA